MLQMTVCATAILHTRERMQRASVLCFVEVFTGTTSFVGRKLMNATLFRSESMVPCQPDYRTRATLPIGRHISPRNVPQ